jgi:plasmid stabilization system protein ParE
MAAGYGFTGISGNPRRLAADRLGEHPEFGSKTDEVDVRRWPMTDFRYTIFYVIERDEHAIEVLRIMDARRVRNLKRVPR